ncbi:MAG: hypothetical protein U0800_21560 [Isosphaeraceae bacterium]
MERRKNKPRHAAEPPVGSPPEPRIIATRADVEQAFRSMVKSLRCPGCNAEYTDDAIDWGDIWLEGRFDLLRETGKVERDGPAKLRCEACGHRAWLNSFEGSVRSAESPGD